MLESPQETALAIVRSEIATLAAHLRAYPDVCVYCGGGAQSRDHLVPITWWGNVNRRHIPTVPSCLDCNNRIGGRYEFTITGRAAIVAGSLRRRWRKELAIEDHPPEWFEQFSGRLRQSLEIRQSHRRFIRYRLEVLECGGAPYHPDYRP